MYITRNVKTHVCSVQLQDKTLPKFLSVTAYVQSFKNDTFITNYMSMAADNVTEFTIKQF